jgi:hypothetical protein
VLTLANEIWILEDDKLIAVSRLGGARVRRISRIAIHRKLLFCDQARLCSCGHVENMRPSACRFFRCIAWRDELACRSSFQNARPDDACVNAVSGDGSLELGEHIEDLEQRLFCWRRGYE